MQAVDHPYQTDQGEDVYKRQPLNENELEWLDDTLAKYAAEGAILDVSELDGLLTAILSAPTRCV